MNSLSTLSSNAREVALALVQLSQRGPIPAVGVGDKSVGVTLMTALGIEHSVTSKPRFKGLVITARRGTKVKDVNRVNLFAKVPDWDLSTCKSSAEILKRYGYDRGGEQKLFCSVRAAHPNSQGLFLEVDANAGLLREKHRRADCSEEDVVAWRLSTLKERLVSSHPESAWVLASSVMRDGQEYFHYRFARFTGAPRVDDLPRLIDTGTITLDHLIFNEKGRIIEKGPLFKIAPQNVATLFPASATFDLMTL